MVAGLGVDPGVIIVFHKYINEFNNTWRREWDSNPRYSFPHTRFPSVRLKPLGHLSGCPLLKGAHDFCKRVRPERQQFPQAADFAEDSPLGPSSSSAGLDRRG